MSVNAKETISIRKKDLVHSKLNRITSAKTVRFYHKATLGQVTIDLNNLSFPSAELPTTSNPSASELAQMRLSLTKKNFRLFSLLEGELIQHDSFQVRDNYTIELTGGMAVGAQADEVFMGELYNAPIDNTVVTDSKNLWRTYDLADAQSSVSLGESFQITNLSYQVGEILVIRNGTNLYRCVGNVITGEGDYIEIDAGDGSSSSIQLKTPASGDAESLIVYFGLQFSGDIALWGQIESMTAAIHALAQDAAQGFYGDSDVDRYLSQNPAEADRRTFGDSVLAILELEVESSTTQYYSISQLGNAMLNRVSEVEFNLATASIIQDGDASIISPMDNPATTMTRFYANKECTVGVRMTCKSATLNNQFRAERYTGAGAVIEQYTENSDTAADRNSGSYVSFMMNAGEYFVARTVSDIQNTADTVQLSFTARSVVKTKIKDLI